MYFKIDQFGYEYWILGLRVVKFCWSKFSLKAELDKFWILESDLFNSTMAQGKKGDLNFFVLHWYAKIFPDIMQIV